MTRWGLLLFCAGAWWLQQQAELPSPLWSYAFIAGCMVRWLARDRLARVGKAADPLLWLCAGFLWAALVAQTRLAEFLPLEWEGKDVVVEGVVAELPVSFGRGSRFRFDVERILTPTAPIPRAIQLAWYDPRSESEPARPTLHAGERWRLNVRLKRPHGVANPHGFDYEYWMLEHGIRATGYVTRTSGRQTKVPNQRLATLVWRPDTLVERIRERVRDRIEGALDDGASRGVLVALAVGEQRAIGPEEWRLFTRTGVNHLMSISGLHITMLSGLAVLGVSSLWRRSSALTLRFPAQKAALVAGLMVATAYAAVAGFAVPAQRTVSMLAVIVLALLLARTWSASMVLALALFVVTLLDPFAVMAPGFWLSFGAVAFMLYVSVYRAGMPSRLTRWVGVQWAVTLGLLPLLLALFQQVSLISPLANAFAIPLVSLIVVPLTLVGVLLPTDALLIIAERIMSLCIALLQHLDRTPLAVWQQATPPAWTLPLALMGVLWLLAPRGFPARAMGVAATLPMFLVAPPRPTPGEVWMDVLDVGQGLAVLLRTARHSLLFDAGPSYSAESDAGDRIVVPYLRAQGISRLSGLIVSHDDSDHAGGAASVLRMTPPDWMASSLPRAHPLSALTNRSLRCETGQAWEWDGVQFDVLHPGSGSYEHSQIKDNNRSCVLRISARGASALLPADIEATAEAWLLGENAHLNHADVLIAPHHGSGTSSSEAFVQRVSPKHVLFTNGYRNSFGHPKDEVVQRYIEAGAMTYRSDQQGAMLLRLGENGVQATSWRAVHRRYWHR